jgi:pyruvate dehydrogenase E2 component (dihydrolipoamide acetyltransferase)
MRARSPRSSFPPGTEGVKVNALIAVLAAEGEDVATAAKGGQRCSGSSPGTEAEGNGRNGTGRGLRHPPQRRHRKLLLRLLLRPPMAKASASFRRRWHAASRRRQASTIRRSPGSGPHGRVVKKDVETAVSVWRRQARRRAGSSSGPGDAR